MTVSSETSRKDFNGSGNTGPFNISDLGIQDETHLNVVHLDAGGTETSYVLTTDYTVNSDLTELTTVANVESGETLAVLRDVPLTQVADYQANSAFPAEVNEDALDKLTQITQQLNERLDRSLQLPASSTTTDITLPEPSEGKGLVWSSGDLVNSTDDFNDIVTDATAQASAASTSATNAAASATSASTSASNAATSATNAATSASNASTSATNAATSETNAATSEANAESAASVVATPWTFDSTTSMADPGTGDIRFNNATVSSVTQIAVSANTADTGNPDISDFVASWDDSTNASDKGKLVIKKRGTPATFAIFTITGTITDNTTWLQIPVSHVQSNGTFSNTDETYTQFNRTGDDGAGSLSNVVDDTSPQLGGNLDVNGQKIVSVSNGNIDIEPNGTGNVLLGNFTFDADQTVGAGQDNYVLTYDNAGGLISLEAAAGGGKDLPHAGYATNRYYNGGLIRESSTFSAAADVLYGVPFVVGTDETFTRIGIEVNATGTATNARLGLYSMAGGIPTDLVFDAGTVGVGSTGTKEVTISQALTAGLYILAVVLDGTCTLTAAGAGETGIVNNILGKATNLGANQLMTTGTHVYAALPDPYPSVSYANNNILVHMRKV